MIRAVLHNQAVQLLVVAGMMTVFFTQTVVADHHGVGDNDSMKVRDSLGRNTSLEIRATISDFEIVMPKSDPLQNTASLDGAMIHIAKLTEERKKTPVTVPAHLILQTVEKNKMAIQSLYEKFLRRDRFLRGKVTLAIAFDVNGIVRSIDIVQNTTKNSLFAAELTHHVRRWIMPKVKVGTNLARAVHTFVFG
jgi:hypothetical protein